MSWGAMVAVLFWGASFVASKIVLVELSPLHLILLRVSLGTLALDALLLRRGRWAELSRLTQHDWVRIGLLVLVSIFVHQLAQMLGLQRTTAINGALLITLAPLFMFAFSVTFMSERVTWLKALGFLTALLGSALIITRGNLRALSANSQTLVGDLLIVLSAIGWALFSTLGKDLLEKQSPLLVVTLVFNLSLPVLAVSTALGKQSFLGALGGMTWRGWGAAAFLAWGCSALAYVLWYQALQGQEMSRVSVLHYLQPLVTTLLGVLLLGESVGWTTTLGGGMILGGVALVNRRQ